MIISQVPGISERLKSSYSRMAEMLARHAIELTGDGEVYSARLMLADRRMVEEEMQKWDRLAVLNERYGLCADYVKALRLVE